MQLNFYFDQSRCVGCKTCVIACKDWNDVPAGPAAWLRIQTTERGQFPRVSVTSLRFSCFHCAKPACILACPTGALSKRKENGIVLINQNLCLPHCQACLQACPYQSPQFRNGDALMEKCDFCFDRLEVGLRPVCVDSCPQRALDLGSQETLLKKYPAAGHWAEGLPDPTDTQPSLLIKVLNRVGRHQR